MPCSRAPTRRCSPARSRRRTASCPTRPTRSPSARASAAFFKAQSLTWTYIILANLLAAKEKPWGFKTLAIKRHRLRLLANRLGVRQRSLYFALVTYALNGDGPEKHMSKKVIGAAYTMLDGKRHDADDDFFRVRALMAKFKVHEDFVAFVREIDDTVGKIEQKDLSKFQVMMMSMFKTLRDAQPALEGLARQALLALQRRCHIVLTLVPPHRTYGPMTHGMLEPIYCGAWHSAANIAPSAPAASTSRSTSRWRPRHIANVDKIMPLLEQIEAMDITPVGPQRRRRRRSGLSRHSIEPGGTVPVQSRNRDRRGQSVKSFSSSSFASDASEQLARAQAAVDKDPQALFTDFQWFLWKGRDTVFYTAFSTDRLDKAEGEGVHRQPRPPRAAAHLRLRRRASPPALHRRRARHADDESPRSTTSTAIPMPGSAPRPISSRATTCRCSGSMPSSAAADPMPRAGSRRSRSAPPMR